MVRCILKVQIKVEIRLVSDKTMYMYLFLLEFVCGFYKLKIAVHWGFTSKKNTVV